MIYEIILDQGETSNKCTISPLLHRPDFQVYPVKGAAFYGPLKADILLHHEGECLSKLKATLGRPNGLATVDCIWRRLDFLFSKILAPIPILARIPDGFKTAYPRRNEKGTDPESGLATIEALFVGSALLGTWDASLFSHYYFGRKFVEINSDRFEELGVHEAKRVDKLPILTPKLRNSEQRKRDRAPL